MENINNIRIFFHKYEEIKYITLSEFFKFCGFSLVSVVIESEEQKQMWKYDIRNNVIIYGNRTKISLMRENDSNWTQLLKEVDDHPEWKWILLKEYDKMGSGHMDIRDMLMKVIEGMSLPAVDRWCLFWLSSVFVTHNMAEANYSLRFLFDKRELELASIYEKFYTVYNETSASEMLRNSKYGNYFIANIKRKINEIAAAMKRRKEFESESLISEIELFLKEYPRFRQAYILQGLVADMDADMRGYSFIYYDKALRYDSQYDDYVLYRMGRYYEKNRENSDIALMYYKRAYTINPGNYRALYKVAFINEWEKKYKQSVMLYEQMCVLLEDYCHAGWAEPLQIEYLFKSYWRLARLYRIRFKQWYMARKVTDKALELSNWIATDRFFNSFYNSAAREKKQKLREYMDIRQIVNERGYIDAEIKHFEKKDTIAVGG